MTRSMKLKQGKSKEKFSAKDFSKLKDTTKIMSDQIQKELEVETTPMDIDDGRSAYCVNSGLIKPLSALFPYLRWTTHYRPGIDLLPTDPFFVGYYHRACKDHSFASDEKSFSFMSNQFDASQFDAQRKILHLTPNFTFFAADRHPVYDFGIVSYTTDDKVAILANYGDKKQYQLLRIGENVDMLDGDKLLSHDSKEGEYIKIKQKLIVELISLSRGKRRDEKLRKELGSKFSWVCKHFGVEANNYTKDFDEIFQHVVEHDDYLVVPYFFTEAFIEKLPVGVFKEPFSNLLRKLNKDYKIDALVRDSVNKKADVSVMEVFGDLGLDRDFSRYAFAAVGQTVEDVCGEGLCSKKITYEVHSKDICLAMLKLCKPRIAYVKVGPSLPGYAPQVSRTCVHSSLNALQTRFIAEYSGVDEKAEVESMQLFRRAVIEQMMQSDCHFKLMTYEQFIDSMEWSASMKRSAYELIPEIEDQEEAWCDNKTRAFAKWEELKQKEALNSRLIQGFALGFSLITGRVIKSLYKSLKPAFSDPNAKMCIGSMMSAEKIGKWTKMRLEEGLDILDADGDSYDSTTRKYPVEFIYAMYEEFYGKRLVGIETLTNSLKLHGSLFAHGIKYKLPSEVFDLGWAPMASGRADTTLTNSLLRLREGLWYLQCNGQLNIGSVIASGDDLRMGVNGMIDIAGPGATLGRKEKLESFSRFGGVFLRKYFYPVGGELIPGSQIGRALSRMCWIKGDVSAKKRLNILKGDAIGRLAVDGHVPILSDFCKRLLFLLEGKKAIKSSKKNFQNWTEYEASHDYDADTLKFTADLYGISVQDVDDLIKYVNKMTLDDDFEHWAFDKIFEKDIGNVKPVRTLWTTGKTYTTVSDAFAWTMPTPAEVPQEYLDWAMLFWQVCIMAPFWEEIFKGLPVVTGSSWAVIYQLWAVCVIALWESHTFTGVFWPDFITRYLMHGFFTYLAWHKWWLPSAVHCIYNFMCLVHPLLATMTPVGFTSSWKVINNGGRSFLRLLETIDLASRKLSKAMNLEHKDDEITNIIKFLKEPGILTGFIFYNFRITTYYIPYVCSIKWGGYLPEVRIAYLPVDLTTWYKYCGYLETATLFLSTNPIVNGSGASMCLAYPLYILHSKVLDPLYQMGSLARNSIATAFVGKIEKLRNRNQEKPLCPREIRQLNRNNKETRRRIRQMWEKRCALLAVLLVGTLVVPLALPLGNLQEAGYLKSLATVIIRSVVILLVPPAFLLSLLTRMELECVIVSLLQTSQLPQLFKFRELSPSIQGCNQHSPGCLR